MTTLYENGKPRSHGIPIKDTMAKVFSVRHVLAMTVLGMIFVAMILFMGYEALSWLHPNVIK